MNADDVIAYYSALATEFGERLTARYQNGIYLVLDQKQNFEHIDKDIASDKFYIVSVLHHKRRPEIPSTAWRSISLAANTIMISMVTTKSGVFMKRIRL